MLSGSVAIVGIGVLHLLAEGSEAAKKALTFYAPMGPLSGKVVISYVVGLILFFLLKNAWAEKNFPNLRTWLYIVIGAVLLGFLFTFTPFVHFVLGE